MYLKIVIEKNNILTCFATQLLFTICHINRNNEMGPFIKAIDRVFDPRSHIFDKCLEIINTNILPEQTYGSDVKPISLDLQKCTKQ